MSQKFMEYLGLLMHQHSLTLGGGGWKVMVSSPVCSHVFLYVLLVAK